MRILILTLILAVAGCASVEKRTDRSSGVGFNSYAVPDSGGNVPTVISN